MKNYPAHVAGSLMVFYFGSGKMENDEIIQGAMEYDRRTQEELKKNIFKKIEDFNKTDIQKLRKLLMHFLLENDTDNNYKCSCYEFCEKPFGEEIYRRQLKHSEYRLWKKKPEPFSVNVRLRILSFLEDDELIYTTHDRHTNELTIILKPEFHQNDFVKKLKEIKIANNDLNQEAFFQQKSLCNQEWKLWDFVYIEQNKQHIQLGEHGFNNFDDVFCLFKKKGSVSGIKKTQLKSGIALIYAIFKYSEKEKKETEHMLISDLFPYGKEFKETWSLWKFENQGVGKKSLSATDCDRANEILSKCSLIIKLKVSQDRKKISVKK